MDNLLSKVPAHMTKKFYPTHPYLRGATENSSGATQSSGRSIENLGVDLVQDLELVQDLVLVQHLDLVQDQIQDKCLVKIMKFY